MLMLLLMLLMLLGTLYTFLVSSLPLSFIIR